MEEKKYRSNVAAVILSKKYPEICEFFIAKRIDMLDAWQFPQGGIDNNETPKNALFRELEEEIGTNQIEILAEYPSWLQYDFPNNIRTKMWPFAGQSQKYFLVKLKNEAKIDINTQHREFDRYEFVNKEEVIKRAANFKLEVYTKVLNYFSNLGFF